jgi:hypothetical protein
MLCLSAAIAAAWPAGAQESIVFTKPPEDPAAKANSFMDQQHQSAPMKMPAPLFNGPQAPANFDASASTPRPQPLTAQQVQELQRQQNERKNWGLMTPAEIFGVPTVEKIFGMPVPEEEKNLTAEERFIRRQQREHNASTTNSLRAAGGVWDANDNPFQKAADRDKRKQDETGGPARRNGLFQSPFNNQSAADQVDDAGPRHNSLWQSVFTTPRALPKEDPEQVAEMERFRALLESQPALETPATPGAASFQSPAAPKAAPEYKAPTAYIPAANFEAQRRQAIGKPIGIAPLPPISTQPKKKDDSQPLVKPPPWLSDKPQPATPPRLYNF